ncbi:DUF551 domain-containing protein [Salmonella enterica subsp. enterica]|nr:protein Eaa [Salmonella enterica subsp. enterica serovar Neukoelln]MLS21131.1 DUF551 domain-containing protein [Salmonella enterica subsp. enterica serovar Neukoelln]
MKENKIRELVNELCDIAIEYHGTQQLRERIARTVRAALHHDLEKLNQPVSFTDWLPELIEGMDVSIDVSTCDADIGNRYFGTVTEVSELDIAKNGYILLVQDAEPNFDVNGNSQVIPDGWISCSERMPEQGAYISAVSKHGEYVAGQVIDDWLDLHDGTSFGLDEVYLWMMLPPLPASPQQ